MIRLAMALVIASSITCAAQETSSEASSSPIRFGVKAGLNLATFNYDNYSAELSPIRTWLAGGVVDIPLSPTFFMSTGVEVASKGAQGKNLLTGADLTINPIYIQIPATINVSFSQWNVGVGAYFARGVAGDQTATLGGVSVSTPIEYGDGEESTFTPFDIGFCSQVGYTIDNFRIGAQIYNGFTNALPKVSRTDDSSIGNFTFGASVTYLF
jgi:hypothetical protein